MACFFKVAQVLRPLCLLRTRNAKSAYISYMLSLKCFLLHYHMFLRLRLPQQNTKCRISAAAVHNQADVSFLLVEGNAAVIISFEGLLQ